MIETNHDSVTSTIMKHKIEKAGMYRFFGNPTKQGGNIGKGTALLVANSIIAPPDGRTAQPEDNEIILTDRKGKTLAVHLYVRGTPTVIVVMHLPHTDADRTEYINTTAAQLSQAITAKMQKDGYDKWPSVIRMADDNMVRDPTVDCVPAEPDCASRARSAMAAMHRAIAPQGMVDAYRHTDPDGRATTYQRVARQHDGTRCRYDIIDVSAYLINSTARLVRTRVRIPDDTMVYYLKGAERCAKRSDHAQVAITLRYTDIPRPPREPAIPQDILEEGWADAEVRNTLITARNLPKDDIDEHTAWWQQRVRETFRRHEKRRRQAEFTAIAKAKAKIAEGEAERGRINRERHPGRYENSKQKLARLRAALAQLYDKRQRVQAQRRGTLAATTADEERLARAPKGTAHAPIMAIQDQNNPSKVHKDQKHLHTAVDNYWKRYLNRPHDANEPDRARATKEVLESMASVKRLPPSAAAELTIDRIVATQNLSDAIDALAKKKHTTPGWMASRSSSTSVLKRIPYRYYGNYTGEL